MAFEINRWTSSYREHLAHWVFRAMRDTAMQRMAWLCAKCGAKATEVHHHNGYPSVPGAFETPDYLTPLCHACHCKAEGKER